MARFKFGRHFFTVLWWRMVSAFRLSMHDKRSKWLTASTFSLLLIIHLVVLPAHVIGSDIGWRSFRYLDLKMLSFALLFAVLESVLINLWMHLLLNKSHCKTTSALGGISIGIVSPLLCCTPLLPTVLSFIAILFPSVVSGLGFKIQYSVNVYQTELLVFALGLLLIAITQNSKYLGYENNGC
mgnify:CR=1 FL=1